MLISLSTFKITINMHDSTLYDKENQKVIHVSVSVQPHESIPATHAGPHSALLEKFPSSTETSPCIKYLLTVILHRFADPVKLIQKYSKLHKPHVRNSKKSAPFVLVKVRMHLDCLSYRSQRHGGM